MLASLNSQHSLWSTVGLNTFKPQYNLLCSFSLFPENRLSLPTIATLFPVITPLSLGIQRILALLVLCHFVGLVLPTLLTENPVGFWNVHHVWKSDTSTESHQCSFMYGNGQQKPFRSLRKVGNTKERSNGERNVCVCVCVCVTVVVVENFLYTWKNVRVKNWYIKY